MITKYKIDNYYTLNIVSRGVKEIILKSSMLEASTRARTGDLAENIKLFENTFVFKWTELTTQQVWLIWIKNNLNFLESLF